MTRKKVEIGALGIKNELQNFKIQSAIAEFIWNGFDAGASVVEIEYQYNEIGCISELKIIDNGSGISLDKLDEKFQPYRYSNKVIDPDATHEGPSAIHGKNGVGRLTFFKFADVAEWSTIYKNTENKYKRFTVLVDESTLDTYTPHDEVCSDGPTQTIVKFSYISEKLSHYDFKNIEDYLATEFAWFLELGSPFPRHIKINGKVLEYSYLIGENKTKDFKINDLIFKVKYVRWNESLRREYSRYYFIDSNRLERGKKTTTFNNKGDNFYHSLYIESDYFDNLEDLYSSGDSDSQEESESIQTSLSFSSIDSDEVLLSLIENLEKYLKQKRSPFIRKRANQLVEESVADGSYPDFGNELWEQHKKRELTQIVTRLYEADPKIFNGLKKTQKKTMFGLFALIMSSSEREDLLLIIEKIVNLNSKERTDLAKILEASNLSNIINTIKLIEDRYKTIESFKKIVFNPSFNANERDHLQTFIEHNFWLFGEQYHLVAKAEDDFEKALKNHIYLLHGENNAVSIDHPDKNREMDVFAVRRLPATKEINNIVIELKHPTDVVLGKKELEQVKDYMSVILDQPMFNGSNMTWEFYLAGKEYNEYIKGELENSNIHGEKHLVFKRPSINYKIYVLTWSEITVNFEIRHDFLLKALKVERDKLSKEGESADEILIQSHKNTAIIRPVNKIQKSNKRQAS
jgi:Histidine kinase-, DNA gyrase B-, and HSP90-like ATPase